jgi:hypothetical protein
VPEDEVYYKRVWVQDGKNVYSTLVPKERIKTDAPKEEEYYSD